MEDEAKCRNDQQPRMTTQQAATLLHAGWTAASRAEPFDRAQSDAWKEGFRLWHEWHPLGGGRNVTLH